MLSRLSRRGGRPLRAPCARPTLRAITEPLRAALAEAERRLDAEAQARLAALVSATVADWAEDAPFTPEEFGHLRALDAETPELADPQEVAAFFAAHGGRRRLAPLQPLTSRSSASRMRR